MKKVAFVAAIVIAALGLTGSAVADGWNGYPPPGFPPPPPVSLFSGNTLPGFRPSTPRPVFVAPQRRWCAPPGFYGYAPGYTYAPGYGSRMYRDGRGRQVIIVTRGSIR